MPSRAFVGGRKATTDLVSRVEPFDELRTSPSRPGISTSSITVELAKRVVVVAPVAVQWKHDDSEQT
jgi:hypothetical protein